MPEQDKTDGQGPQEPKIEYVDVPLRVMMVNGVIAGANVEAQIPPAKKIQVLELAKLSLTLECVEQILAAGQQGPPAPRVEIADATALKKVAQVVPFPGKG